MAYKQILVLVLSAWLVAGQRPSFAGTKPIGFPDVVTPADPLGNRFGDNSPLPVEAKGDRALVERLSKLPIDKQPFWFINWKAVEAAQKNPQTYPQRENSFTDRFGQSQSANFQPSPSNTQTSSGANPSNTQSNSGASSSDLTSKFGETNNAGSGNFANGASNFASTNHNNRPSQQGYNRQYRRGF